jgi:protein TonB
MRIFNLVLIFLILSSSNISAQKDGDDNTKAFIEYERMASFINGDLYGFALWVYQNIKYPETAIQDAVSGKIIAKYKVDSLGMIKDIEIVRGGRWDLETEVKRVLCSSPIWTPARLGGENVSVFYLIPIEFDIKDQYFIKKIKYFNKRSNRSKKIRQSG